MKNKIAKDIPQISECGFAAWKFISAIYESGWDKLTANQNNNSFRQYVSLQFNKISNNRTTTKPIKRKQADMSRIPLPIPPRLSKTVLAKSKYFNKNQLLNSLSSNNNCLYTQASKSDIENIIRIKDAFLKLPSIKVNEIHKVINNSTHNCKPKINIITKSPSKKQIIISMSTNNSERIIIQANSYISNINRLLKDIKSEVFTDYIWSDNKRVVIITNKVAVFSDLKIIEKYIKNLNDINSNDVISPRLPQSKSYLNFRYSLLLRRHQSMSEFKIVNSNYFIFSFLICYFLLFYFGDLGLGLMWHHCYIPVTWQGHSHILYSHISHEKA